MATIWDADVLIWAASQILAAHDWGLPTSRFFRFTPYQLLIAIGGATGNREYQLLKGALTRLQSTVLRTTIRHGEHWRRQQFSWINEWEELTTRTGRCEGMEFVLPEWFYQGVLDRRLVLAIDPAYFALSGGIERGRQRDGWRFELRHLHAKSASLARLSDFALDIRRIVARQPLPGYLLAVERHDGCELIVMRPNPSTGSVDKLCISSAAIGISGASRSGLRAHRLPLARSPHGESGAPKDCKSESKLFVVGEPSRAGKSRGGSARRRERALNQQGGVGKTTLALHLAGIWGCQKQRVAVIDADPDGCALEWSELRTQEALPSRFTIIAIARDTLHPIVAREVDRAIIDGPLHIEAITRSALMAADLPVQPPPFQGLAFVETLRLANGMMTVRPHLRIQLVLNRCNARASITRGLTQALADYDRRHSQARSPNPLSLPTPWKTAGSCSSCRIAAPPSRRSPRSPPKSKGSRHDKLRSRAYQRSDAGRTSMAQEAHRELDSLRPYRRREDHQQ
jgi:hypothetical protein